MKATTGIQGDARYRAASYDVREIAGTAHLLIMKAQEAGNLCFDGHPGTPQERVVTLDARRLADRISSVLIHCKAEDTSTLLECYADLYRIGYRQMPPADFIDRQTYRIIKSWREGNRRIEESVIFGILSEKVRRTRSGFSGRISAEENRIYDDMLSRWLQDLQADGRFSDISSWESYQRLALVMRSDLSHRLGANEEKLKKQWYKANLISEIDELPTQVLRSYRRFIVSLSPAIFSFAETSRLLRPLLEELASRTDLHPSDRQAFRHSLAFLRS